MRVSVHAFQYAILTRHSTLASEAARACYNLIFVDDAGGRTVPLYEYECVKCHKKTEKIENVSGPHLKKCPHCGGKVESVLSAPAIQFKGAGWYVTDYAGKKTTDSESKPAGKESSKDGAKETTKEPAKESKEKKPAKK
jgi:putative FmdB family regulatory protein